MARFDFEDGSPVADNLRGAHFDLVYSVRVRIGVDVEDDDGPLPYTDEDLESDVQDTLLDAIQLVHTRMPWITIDLLSRDHLSRELLWGKEAS